MPPRTRLSIGASGVAKVFTVIVALVMAGVAAFVALIGYGFAYASDTLVTSSTGGVSHIEDGKVVDGPAGPPEFVGGAGAVAGGVGALCSLFFILVAGYLVLRVLRGGAWLEGSVLHVRGALKTKSQNLATASISGGTQQQTVGAGERRAAHPAQTLNATDPANGKVVTLPLRGAGLAILPSDQLMMLANAITNQRVRSGPDDTAFVVADRLRDLARDPFA